MFLVLRSALASAILTLLSISIMPAPLADPKQRKKVHPTKRQRKLVRNLTTGKFASRKAAALNAGYTETSARAVTNILNRPLVKSALTEAMARIGITHELLLTPIKEALTATRSYVDPVRGLVETEVPDHKMRLEASRDGVAIFGGIPKVGEGTPTAHGLNLFVAIDNGRGGSVQVATHGLRPPGSPTKPNVAITVQDDAPKNVQARRAAPLSLIPHDPSAPNPDLND